MSENFIDSISKKYDLRIIQVKEGDEYYMLNHPNIFINNCFCFLKKREIYLGLFKNQEFKIAMLFHEIGHLQISNYDYEIKNIYTIEKIAWQIGFKLAKKNNLYFQKKTFLFASKCLKSYKKFNDETLATAKTIASELKLPNSKL
jgi:hypothetical protein